MQLLFSRKYRSNDKEVGTPVGHVCTFLYYLLSSGLVMSISNLWIYDYGVAKVSSFVGWSLTQNPCSREEPNVCDVQAFRNIV
jgi:hypothetical protein